MDRRAALELEALHEISKVLWLGTDLNKAFTSTLTILGLTLEMENGTLSLFDPVTGEVFVEAAPEMSDDERILGRLRPGEGIIGRIFKTGMPMVVPDIGTEPLFLNRTGTWKDLAEDPRAFIGVPVRHARSTLGVLTVDRRLRAGPFSFDRDVRFLGLVAGMAGARVRLQELENPRRREVAEPGERPPRPGLVAAGPRMRQLMDRVELVARSRATVFLRGESGTGKEVVAHAIHDASPRAARPFVAVNCAALPETLVESELFGYEKGAFTGAAAAQKGRFEMADGGTLFLDEVAELSPAAQAKLLRVVQERQFERVGGRRTVTVDVRIVAATNRDVEEAVRSGAFRLDLYHRLSVVMIVLPPLRERREDIPALADHFLRVLGEENGRLVELAPEALDAALRCRWSGNVRQLRNCLERAVVSSSSARIGAADLCLDASGCFLEAVNTPVQIGAPTPAVNTPVPMGAPTPAVDVAALTDERERVRAALETCGHVQAKAARLLGLSERQLAYRIRKYAIPVRRF